MPPAALTLARLAAGPDPGPPDAQLLRAFAAARDDDPFAELVRRHGPMVLAACRRALGNPHDAEDAFQATFLVLARKAHAVRGNLAGWLYAVAVRTARGVRIMRDRRRKHELLASGRREPAGPSADPDLARVIDEELAKLADHYREAVVLCELRGLSRKQAAAELGIPEGTLSSRLAAAKRKLAALLAARGLAAPAVLVLAPAAVSANLAAAAVAAARGAAGPVASAAASAVVKGMLFDQLKAVTLAAGILLTAVCGGLAMTGSPADQPGPAVAPAPRPADHSKLVEQLGAPEFADREAAEKSLRELGVKAKPALRAGLKSDSPEVRDRAAKALAVVRRDQIRDVFVRIAGDDKPARDLFAKVVSSQRGVNALEAVLDDPARADEAYRTRTAELMRVAAGHPPVDADGKAGVPTSPDIWAAPPVPLGDVAGWLLLGTLQPGTASWADYTVRGWEHRLGTAVPFLPEDDHTSAKPIAAAYAAPDAAPLKKLTAAWLAKRRENDMLRAGLALAVRYDIADALPAARALLSDPKPTGIHSPNLAGIAVFVGLHGTKDDLPLLARHAADDRSFGTWMNLPPGTELQFTPPVKEGRDLFCHVRDAVAASMCKLAGKDPADFGLPAFPQTKHPNGAPMSLMSATKVGFQSKADRAKAFEKAAAWLKSFEPPAGPKQPEPDPAVVKLVEQLGAPEFADREAAAKELRKLGFRAEAALKAGLRVDNPEVRDRSAKVLAEVRADALDALTKGFDPAKDEQPDHPLWRRFKGIAGDSRASRDLFARIIANPKWLRTLDRAEADPTAAGHVYRVGVAEVFRDFHNDPDPSPEWPCNRGEEVAYLLFLGSYAADPGTKLEGDEIPPQNLRNTDFLGRGIIRGEGQITHARGLPLGLEGKLLDTSKGDNPPAVAASPGTDRVFAKLYIAWFARRDPSAEGNGVRETAFRKAKAVLSTQEKDPPAMEAKFWPRFTPVERPR